MSDHRNTQITPLLHALREGTISEADAAALAAAVAADPEAQRAYLESIFLWAAVREDLAGSAPAAAPAQPASAGRTHIFRIPPIAYPLAAALLLAAAAVAVYFAALTPDPRPLTPGSTPVATVIETTGTLVVDDTIVNSGDDIRSGELSLDTGSADFRLTNGVNISLRGQTQLTVRNAMSATLTQGEAVFDCPHSAAGYTVHLPGGLRVVDLGTRFQLRVDAGGQIEARVIVGRVRVERGPGESIVLDRDRFIRLGSADPLAGVRVLPAPNPATPIGLVNGDFSEPRVDRSTYVDPTGWRIDARHGTRGVQWIKADTQQFFWDEPEGTLSQSTDSTVLDARESLELRCRFGAGNTGGYRVVGWLLLDGAAVATQTADVWADRPADLIVTYAASAADVGKRIGVEFEFQTLKPRVQVQVGRVSLVRSGPSPADGDDRLPSPRTPQSPQP